MVQVMSSALQNKQSPFSLNSRTSQGLNFGSTNTTTPVRPFQPQYKTPIGPQPKPVLGPTTGPALNLNQAYKGGGLVQGSPNSPLPRAQTAAVGSLGSTGSSQYSSPAGPQPQSKSDQLHGLLGKLGILQSQLKAAEQTQPATNPTPTAPLVTPPPTTPPVDYENMYKNLVGSLGNQGNSPYNTMATGAISNLNTTAQGNQQYADRAKEIADAAGQQITDIGRQGARAEAGQLTTGTSPVAEGNAAVTAQTAAAQQQAVAQGANMQLAGNAQGLTAQGQQQSGYNAAAGQSLTGQGTAQSALGTAAGYAQPSSNFPFVYNPLTQSFSAPGVNDGGATAQGTALTYNPQTDSKNFASQVINGQLSYADAIQALSYGGNGPNAKAQLTQAIIAQGGNPTVLEAQAQTQGNFAQKYQQGLAGLKQASGLEGQIVDSIQRSGLNNVPISAITGLKELLAGQTSNPAQQQLSTQVAQYIQALGLDPNTISSNPATQQYSSLGSLLKALKTTATNNNEVFNPKNYQSSYGGAGGKNITSSLGRNYNLPFDLK